MERVKTSGKPDERGVMQKLEQELLEGKTQYVGGYIKETPKGAVFVPPYLRHGPPRPEVTVFAMTPEERKRYIETLIEAEEQLSKRRKLENQYAIYELDEALRDKMYERTSYPMITGFPKEGHPKFPFPVYQNTLFIRMSKKMGDTPWSYAQKALAEGFKLPKAVVIKKEPERRKRRGRIRGMDIEDIDIRLPRIRMPRIAKAEKPAKVKEKPAKVEEKPAKSEEKPLKG